MFGGIVCAASAGAISLVPDGAWLLFALLRFGVGAGLGGSAAPILALTVEYTPTRYRTVIPGLTIVLATVGTLLASLTAATLLTRLGWRGVAAIGVVPAVAAILIILVAPESVRWLVTASPRRARRLPVYSAVHSTQCRCRSANHLGQKPRTTASSIQRPAASGSS